MNNPAAKNRLQTLTKSLLLALISLVALSLLVFFMSRLAPGDVLYSYYGDRAERMSDGEREQTMARLGLDQPLPAQYGLWLERAFAGDLGISYKYKLPVGELIADRLPQTLLLGGLGFILIFGLALGLGLFCAAREGQWPDRLCCRLGVISSCIPSFWLALGLILIFCVWLGWLPSSGAYGLGQQGSLASRLIHLILPLSALVISHLWYYAYLIRNKLLEEVGQDYVIQARAKGLSRWQVVWSHCLPNILPAYFSLMAVSVPHILGGTYGLEMVFSYPGLGQLTLESAKYHDYNILMVLALLTGATVILASVLADLAGQALDPRMKLQSQVVEELKEGAAHG